MSIQFGRLKARRHFAIALAAGAALAALGPVPAVAQGPAYPTRTVRIVLPLPPGTVNDSVLRLLADPLPKAWGQRVTVDNKPGGSTTIGTDTVVRAPADGYTLLANVSLIAQNQSLRKKLPYDATRDLVPVVQINRQQLLLVVRSDFPVHSVSELAAYAKANPGKVNFRRWGLGWTPHLVAEDGGGVVGYTYAAPYRSRSAYRYSVENSVYVRNGIARRGLGRALLAELIARCERLGLRQIVAVIGDSGNAASIGLHAALGFRMVGVLKDVGFKHGRWVDSVLMQREIAEASERVDREG